MDEAAFALTDRADQHTTEVLQLVVLHKAIGIAVVVPMGSSGADAILREGEIGFNNMSGVFAHEGKDSKNLGSKKYPDNPRTQTACCGCWNHKEPDWLLRLNDIEF
jgi:hypothetical protein